MIQYVTFGVCSTCASIKWQICTTVKHYFRAPVRAVSHLLIYSSWIADCLSPATHKWTDVLLKTYLNRLVTPDLLLQFSVWSRCKWCPPKQCLYMHTNNVEWPNAWLYFNFTLLQFQVKGMHASIAYTAFKNYLSLATLNMSCIKLVFAMNDFGLYRTNSYKDSSHCVLYIVTPHSAITVVCYCTIIVQSLYHNKKGSTPSCHFLINGRILFVTCFFKPAGPVNWLASSCWKRSHVRND